MLKVAICDDQKAIVSQIKKLIHCISKDEKLSVDVKSFYSGEALEKDILSGHRYDLLYLDIKMGGANGIEAATNIRKIDEDMLIIFVSSYDSYYRQLFRIGVFSFIKKPLEKDEFTRIFHEANNLIHDKNRYFTFHFRFNEFKILLKDILFFESGGRKITVHQRDGKEVAFNAKLKDIEKNLTPSKIPFLRIHQSYLVNFHLIRSRSRNFVTLINEVELPISEDRLKMFNKEYAKLLGDEINV